MLGKPTFYGAKVVATLMPARPGWEPQQLLDRFKLLGQYRDVSPTTEYEQMLRGAALRVTRPRLAVLSAVHDRPHSDTDSIIAAVRAEAGEVSHQAVYDVLHLLTRTRLVRRIQPAGSVARYEARVGDNHHHVVCRSCAAIADVDCAVGHTPCLTASDDHGFLVDEAEVFYWGSCSDCMTASSQVYPTWKERHDRSQG